MMDSHKPQYLTTELDLDLLAQPFKVQTNWHVITGAPCSGKTTIIKLAAGKGYMTISEAGREYVEEEIARGRTLDEIRSDGIAFDHVIKDLQWKMENQLRPADFLFLDRGFPDSMAFYRLFGLNPNEILPQCFLHRYASVFILNRFPTQKDSARVEDEATAKFLDEWHARDYCSLGYEVVRVPVLPPEERLEFILERIITSGRVDS